jgi:M6 family metalloprotease-like protein
LLIVLVLSLTWPQGLAPAIAQEGAPQPLAPSVTPLVGQRIGINGLLAIKYGDPAPGTPRAAHQQIITLTDDAGRAFVVDVTPGTQLSGPLHSLNGSRVTLAADVAVRTVDAAGTQQMILRAQEIRSAPGARATNRTIGNVKWATLLCRFPDDAEATVANFPPAFFGPLIIGPFPSAESYWIENSRNQVNFANSTVHDWVVLPKTRGTYLASTPEQYLDELAVDCAAAHKTATNLDFTSYGGVNLMLSTHLDPVNPSAWGGISPLTLGGVNKAWPTTFLPEFAFKNQNFVAHEMGHAFRLPHSSGAYGQVYDSKWDVMSDGGVCTAANRHPQYNCLGDHTIAYHKDIAEWIPANRKFTPTVATGQTITLERTSQPPLETGTFLMAQIPLGGTTTQFYTVEARKFIGYDTTVPAEGLVIHKVDTARTESTAQVVDPDNNQDPNDAASVWTVGETFTDAANNVRIEVLAQTSTGFSVRFGPQDTSTPTPTPTPTQPTTPAAPKVGVQTRQVGPGRLEVTVTAQNSTAVPANTLREIRFGVATNAIVDVPGGPTGFPGGQTVALPTTPTSTTFFVNRVAPGPFMVRFEVVDATGPWATFVGAGGALP